MDSFQESQMPEQHHLCQNSSISSRVRMMFYGWGSFIANGRFVDLVEGFFDFIFFISRIRYKIVTRDILDLIFNS